jgi:hypothetical protein
MSNKSKYIRPLGWFTFSIGIIIGAILAIIIVWGDLEGSLFTTGIKAKSSLRTLKCPAIITPGEVAEISAVLRNPTDKDFERYTQAHITDGFVSLIRESKERIPVAANSRQKIAWNITADDAAYERIILFRIYINARYPKFPSLGGTCGVVRLNIDNLTGGQVFWLMLGSALGLLISGRMLTRKNRHLTRGERNTNNSMTALAVVIFLAIGIGSFGYWIFGLICLACALLLSGIIIGRQFAFTL